MGMAIICTSTSQPTGAVRLALLFRVEALSIFIQLMSQTNSKWQHVLFGSLFRCAGRTVAWIAAWPVLCLYFKQCEEARGAVCWVFVVESMRRLGGATATMMSYHTWRRWSSSQNSVKTTIYYALSTKTKKYWHETQEDHLPLHLTELSSSNFLCAYHRGSLMDS